MKEAKHYHTMQSTIDLEERTVKKNTEDGAVKINTALEKNAQQRLQMSCAPKQIFSVLYSFYLIWDFISVRLLLYMCVHMCTFVYLYKYSHS